MKAQEAEAVGNQGAVHVEHGRVLWPHPLPVKPTTLAMSPIGLPMAGTPIHCGHDETLASEEPAGRTGTERC